MAKICSHYKSQDNSNVRADHQRSCQDFISRAMLCTWRVNMLDATSFPFYSKHAQQPICSRLKHRHSKKREKHYKETMKQKLVITVSNVKSEDSSASVDPNLLPYCCLVILHCCVSHACLPRTCNMTDKTCLVKIWRCTYFLSATAGC